MQLKIYKSGFGVKRKEQIETAKKIASLPDYAKQYKLIKMLVDTVFPLMNDSMTILKNRNHTPSSPFPIDKELQDALGHVYENVMLFGDVLLRLPDITKKVYKKEAFTSHHVLEWALDYCKQSMEIFSGHHATQLHLMAQELGFIPEDPGYTNPFRIQATPTPVSKPPKQKKATPRGPKLRGSKHTEL
eukprot:Em0022g525a